MNDAEPIEPKTKQEQLVCVKCLNLKYATDGWKHEKEDGKIDKICAECWPEYAEENGLCESCGSELEPIYENNGFTMPEGPEKWEVSGYKPCDCSQSDEE